LDTLLEVGLVRMERENRTTRWYANENPPKVLED
jgi:hypothetical protein